MLSRVADSIFWMSRYVERAENVARFIDVNWNLLLDSGSTQDEQWQPLINATGDEEAFAKRYTSGTRENVIRFLTFDTENPNSIICCVRAARENARTVRDVISPEMWEQMNSFHLMLKDAATDSKAFDSPHEFFSQVKMASHLFLGMTDTTMGHGESWNFYRLGQLLERCDKTSRILDVKYYMLHSSSTDSDADGIQWAAVLKSASGLEMYRKRHRRIVPERVVEFLLFDPEFPRAAFFCIKTANEALHAITNTPAGQSSCAAEEQLNRICADIQKTTAADVLISGLHQYVDSLQTKLNEVGVALHEGFFSTEDKPTQTQSQSQG